jgi:hypothetical protein
MPAVKNSCLSKYSQFTPRYGQFYSLQNTLKLMNTTNVT